MAKAKKKPPKPIDRMTLVERKRLCTEMLNVALGNATDHQRVKIGEHVARMGAEIIASMVHIQSMGDHLPIILHPDDPTAKLLNAIHTAVQGTGKGHDEIIEYLIQRIGPHGVSAINLN